MKGKIIIPSWNTLKAEGLVTRKQGHECISKIKLLYFLKQVNPDAKNYIDLYIFKDWPSYRDITSQDYIAFRAEIRRHNTRIFSNTGVRIICEGEEEDDNV